MLILFPLNKSPGVRWLYQIVVLCSDFSLSVYCLHNGCRTLHFHQWCIGIPFSPHPHQHLLFWFLVDTHSNWIDVEAHCCLSLHFPCSWWSWASLHVSAGCACFILWQMPVHTFSPFLNKMVCFAAGVSFLNSLYILDIIPLSNVLFAIMFSYSVSFLFTLLRAEEALLCYIQTD